jgi:phage tail protein X
MADDLPFEFPKVQGDSMTPSQVVWHRYRRPAPGILGKFLDANPHVAPALADGPFIPSGTVVRIPIDQSILAGRPRVLPTVRLTGE